MKPTPEEIIVMLAEAEDVIVELADDEATRLAKKIAFYTSLIHTRPTDPANIAVDINDMIDYLREKQNESIEEFVKRTDHLLT